MKRLAYILLIFLASCSPSKRAQWHLGRALHLDRDVIKEKRDTVEYISIEYKDSIIHVESDRRVIVVSDTVRVVDTITERKDRPLPNIEMEASSKDGIAHARFWTDQNTRNLEAWAVLDTVLKLQDSIKVQYKIITRQRDIIVNKEAKITEYRTLREKIKDGVVVALWVIGGVVLIVVILKIWKNDKS